jgi:hypothetical protein
MGDGVAIKIREVKCQTEKALLVLTDSGELWLPKSQIEKDAGGEFVRAQEDGASEIVVSRWIAEQKGLLDDGEEKEEQRDYDGIPF